MNTSRGLEAFYIVLGHVNLLRNYYYKILTSFLIID